MMLKNGQTLHMKAESMMDDPALDEIHFYYNDAVKSLFATVKRSSLVRLTVLQTRRKPSRLRLLPDPSRSRHAGLRAG